MIEVLKDNFDPPVMMKNNAEVIKILKELGPLDIPKLTESNQL